MTYVVPAFVNLLNPRLPPISSTKPPMQFKALSIQIKEIYVSIIDGVVLASINKPRGRLALMASTVAEKLDCDS